MPYENTSMQNCISISHTKECIPVVYVRPLIKHTELLVPFPLLAQTETSASAEIKVKSHINI